MWKCQRLTENYRMKKGLEDSNGTERTATHPAILVIEDDRALSHLIQTNLRRLGFHTDGVSDGAEAIDWIVNNAVTLALLDYRLPDMSGEQVMKALARQKRTVPFIVITGHGDEKVAVEMMKLGARDYLVKDTAFLDRLPRAVERTIKQLAIEDKLAEAGEVLRESEGKYRTLLETSAAPVYWVEVPGGEITFVNKKAEELFGRKRKDLLGRKLFEFVPEDEVALHREKMKEAAKEMKIEQQPIPQVIVRPGGELRYTEVYPILFQSEGKIVGQVVCPDITERKQAEEELTKSEAKYRSLIETTSAGVAITDLKGEFTLVNEALCLMIGYSPEELIGKPFADFLHPEDRTGVVTTFINALKGQITHPSLEFRVVHKDGHDVWCASSPTALTHEKHTTGFNAIITDITERKRAEEAVRESEEKLRLMFHCVEDSIVATDLEGNIVEANDAAVHMFGYISKEQLIGRSAVELVSPRERARLMHDMGKTLEEGHPILRSEYAVVGADGMEYEAEISNGLLCDSSGNPA